MLEPKRLRTVAELEIPERCMARFSCDRSADREYVYFTTRREVRRLIYHSQRLGLDRDWAGSDGVVGDSGSGVTADCLTDLLLCCDGLFLLHR